MTKDAIEILGRADRDDYKLQQEIAVAEVCAQIAEEVYAARTQRGLTQKELADVVGTTQSAIARIEDADYGGHSIRTVAKIALALDFRVAVSLKDQAVTTCVESESDAFFLLHATSLRNLEPVDLITTTTPYTKGSYAEKAPQQSKIQATKRRGLVPPIWFDNMGVLLRGDVPVVTLVFDALIHDTSEAQEVARLMTPVEHVKRIIDMLAQIVDYYPERPKAEESKDEK